MPLQFSRKWCNGISAISSPLKRRSDSRLNRICVRWDFDEYPGDSTLAFELSGTEEGVLVRVIDTIIEDFPQDVPEFKRESCRGGWEYFLGRLKEYVEEK